MAVNRFLEWGLTASVILNLLLTGLAIGLLWMSRTLPPPPPGFGTEFSTEGRETLFGAGFRNREKMVPLMNEARAARGALTQTLSAPVFDPQSYDAAAKALKDAQIRILDEKSKMLREAATSLPPEERRKLALRLSAGPKNRNGERTGNHFPHTPITRGKDSLEGLRSDTPISRLPAPEGR
jgi:uncharacterized membrane protein